MKNDLKHNIISTSKLTVHVLLKLKNAGFRYVLVKGFTRDRRLDYVSPCYLLLVPIKDIPADLKDKDIYEPIDSSILTDWAKSPNEGIEVLIASSK